MEAMVAFYRDALGLDSWWTSPASMSHIELEGQRRVTIKLNRLMPWPIFS